MSHRRRNLHRLRARRQAEREVGVLLRFSRVLTPDEAAAIRRRFKVDMQTAIRNGLPIVMPDDVVWSGADRVRWLDEPGDGPVLTTPRDTERIRSLVRRYLPTW